MKNIFLFLLKILFSKLFVDGVCFVNVVNFTEVLFVIKLISVFTFNISEKAHETVR